MVYERERAQREKIEKERRGREPRHRSQTPAGMTDDDVMNLNEVRRTVWRQGIQGLLVGMVAGSAGVLAVKHFKLRRVTPAHWTFGTLAVGALGSFVGALVAGKNSSFLLESVFSRGSTSSQYLRSAAGEFEAQRDESHRKRVEQIKKAQRFKEQQERLQGGGFVADGRVGAFAADGAAAGMLQDEPLIEETIWVDSNMNVRREYR